jgi:phenylacetate-CoA ligase
VVAATTVASHGQMVGPSAIVAALRRLNSEFAHYVPAQDQTPGVDLRECGDPEYFPVGVTHRYTRAGWLRPYARTSQD